MKFIVYCVAIALCGYAKGVTNDGMDLFKSLVKAQNDAIQGVHCEWQVQQTLFLPNPIENSIHYMADIESPTRYIIEQDFNGQTHFEYRASGDKMVYVLSDQQKRISMADNPERVFEDLIYGLPSNYIKRTINLGLLPAPSQTNQTKDGIDFQWNGAGGFLKMAFTGLSQSVANILVHSGNADQLKYVCSEKSVLNGLVPLEVWITENKRDGSPHLKQHWTLVTASYAPGIKDMDFTYPIKPGYSFNYIAADKSFELQTDDLLLQKSK
jgi:hypothetical protein